MYRNCRKEESIMTWILKNGEMLIEEDRKYKEEAKKAEAENCISNRDCPLKQELYTLFGELGQLAYLNGYRDCHRMSNGLRNEGV